jgi:hypothetical protein
MITQQFQSPGRSHDVRRRVAKAFLEECLDVVHVGVVVLKPFLPFACFFLS